MKPLAVLALFLCACSRVPDEEWERRLLNLHGDMGAMDARVDRLERAANPRDTVFLDTAAIAYMPCAESGDSVMVRFVFADSSQAFSRQFEESGRSKIARLEARRDTLGRQLDSMFRALCQMEKEHGYRRDHCPGGVEYAEWKELKAK